MYFWMSQNLNCQQACWSLFLAWFDFSLIHIEISYISNLKVIPSDTCSDYIIGHYQSLFTSGATQTYNVPPSPMLCDRVGHFHLCFEIGSQSATQIIFSLSSLSI